jgi:hypothetical protein
MTPDESGGSSIPVEPDGRELRRALERRALARDAERQVERMYAQVLAELRPEQERIRAAAVIELKLIRLLSEAEAKRIGTSGDGTFGRLYVSTGASELKLCTVEDDWLDNRPSLSCIPAGYYTLRRTIYRKHGYETFEVTKVPGRSRILIHPANTEQDVEGCIGVGLRFGRLVVARDEDTGEPKVEKSAVVSSREAFRRFMEAMAWHDEAALTVQWLPESPLTGRSPSGGA